MFKMKKLLSYHVFYIVIGVFLVNSGTSTGSYLAKIILNSLGFLLLLVGLVLMLNTFRNKGKPDQGDIQNVGMMDFISGNKLGYILMSLFGSILSLISILLLLLFFSVEKIEMWRVFLIGIAIVQAVIMIISSVGVFRYFNRKTGDN